MLSSYSKKGKPSSYHFEWPVATAMMSTTCSIASLYNNGCFHLIQKVRIASEAILDGKCKLLHHRCRYLIIYFTKIPIRFGEIEDKICEQGLRLYDNYGLIGSFPYRHFFYSNQKR